MLLLFHFQVTDRKKKEWTNRQTNRISIQTNQKRLVLKFFFFKENLLIFIVILNLLNIIMCCCFFLWIVMNIKTVFGFLFDWSKFLRKKKYHSFIFVQTKKTSITTGNWRRFRGFAFFFNWKTLFISSKTKTRSTNTRDLPNL